MGVNVGPGVGEYNPSVDHVNNGEEASEVVFRRPSINLENRTEALKEFIEAEELRIDALEVAVPLNSSRLSVIEPLVAVHESVLTVIEPLALNALQPFPVVTAIADFTAETDKIYVVDPLLAVMNIQLPPPADATVITIKDISNDIPTKAVNIIRNGAELVDGKPEDFALTIPLQAVTFVSNGVDWFLINTGSGSGTGDANDITKRMDFRLYDGLYRSYTPVVFGVDLLDLVDVGNTTATLAPAVKAMSFGAVGQVVSSIQMLDDQYLLGENNILVEDQEPIFDIASIELMAFWNIDEDAVENAGVYEVSRDGGNEYQAVTMEKIPGTDTFRGTLNFAEEAANALVQSVGGVSTGVTDFTAAGNLSRVFTLANPATIKKFEVELTVTGSPVGYLNAVLVRDNVGVPSVDPLDRLYTTASVDLSALATGTQIFSVVIPKEAGIYHLVLETSDAYKTEYTSSVGANKIAVASDATGMIFNLEGRELDVRVRITSGTLDRLLTGFGVYYGPTESISLVSGQRQRYVETFDGIVDNTNSFTLPWTPDPILLDVYEHGTGQTYRYSTNSGEGFVLDGNSVIFPVNTFQKVGDITLEFLQRNGTTISNDATIEALMAANHMGSNDPNIDLSVPGRGLVLAQDVNGIKKEIALDEFGFIMVI